MKDIINDRILENIEFIEKINDAKLLGGEIINKIFNDVERIKENIINEEVKLAILGEFSSGKSTFINALLQDNILTVSDEPTTAVNTYIKYGEEKRAVVEFLSGEKMEVSISKLDDYLKESSRNKDVKKVDIFYPNEVLKKGLTIIDTPGANADIKEHDLMRNEAIDEANASVFIISIQRLTSKTFIDFLNGNKERLSKFIFVINKCDTIEDELDDSEDVLKRAVDYVAKSIKYHGGINCSKVFTISAKNYFKKKSSSVIDVEKNFNDLVSVIDDMIKKDKEFLALFNVLKLQKDLFEEIDKIVNNRNQLFALKLQQIVGEINSIDALKVKIKEKTANSFNEALDKLNDRYISIHEEVFEECFKQVKSHIESIGSVGKLKKEGPPFVKNSVDNVNIFLSSFINSNSELILEKEKTWLVSEFERYFENLKEAYRHLKIDENLFRKRIRNSFLAGIVCSLLTFLICINKFPLNLIYGGATFFISSILVFFLTSLKSNFDFSISNYKRLVANTEQNSFTTGELAAAQDGTKNAATTAGKLAIVGGIVAGPLGVVVGGVIGGVIGASSGSDINEIRNNYLREINYALNNVENKIRYTNIEFINKLAINFNSSIDLIIEQIIEKYNYLLEKIMSYQKDTLNEINELKDRLNEINIEVQQRIANLEDEITIIKKQLE